MPGQLALCSYGGRCGVTMIDDKGEPLGELTAAPGLDRDDLAQLARWLQTEGSKQIMIKPRLFPIAAT